MSSLPRAKPQIGFHKNSCRSTHTHSHTHTQIRPLNCLLLEIFKLHQCIIFCRHYQPHSLVNLDAPWLPGRTVLSMCWLDPCTVCLCCVSRLLWLKPRRMHLKEKRCGHTDTFQKFDLIQGRLCECLSALHHLQSHKTPPPACKWLWQLATIMFISCYIITILCYYV